MEIVLMKCITGTRLEDTHVYINMCLQIHSCECRGYRLEMNIRIELQLFFSTGRQLQCDDLIINM